MTTLSAARLLYLTHLAERLRAYETGAQPIDAKAFRLFARRLRQATLGTVESRLIDEMGFAYPEVVEALQLRYFDTHGRLGAGAEERRAQQLATQWLEETMARR